MKRTQRKPTARLSSVDANGCHDERENYCVYLVTDELEKVLVGEVSQESARVNTT